MKLLHSTYWNGRMLRAARAGQWRAVGITLGRPPRGTPYDCVWLPAFGPDSSLFRIQDQKQFRSLFRERLAVQWSTGWLVLEAIDRQEPDKPIVLLCWEDLRLPGEWCHRQIVADFITEQTGEIVEEIS